MRVVVTGASGFIGSNLVRCLEAKGHRVCRAGRQTAHEPWEGFEALVHLANIAHTRADPAALWRINVEGTLATARKAVAAGIRRFVFMSSVKAAGEAGDRYGRAKLAAETDLARLGREAGLEIVVLRPPLVYGPGVKANFLSLMRALHRGWPLPFASIANRRSLIYVGNLSDAVLQALTRAEGAGQTYFVADGAPVSTPELCRALGRALGRPARLFAFPPALLPARLAGSLEVDDAAIRRELGWRPPFSFEAGLRATADWYLGR
jgi:UDP-glucose 4-epimerase